MNRTFRAVLVVGATVAALAACTSPQPGNPTSAPATGGTSGSGPTKTAPPSSGGASDLGLTKSLSAPCDILTKEQQVDLATFREAKPANDGPNGPSCTYQGKDVLENSTFKIIFVVKTTPIDDMIQTAKSTFPKTAKDTKIDGRRAVTYDSADAKQNCNAVVATSATQGVLIQAAIGVNDKLNDGNACGTAERVATTIIGNLKR